MIIICYDSVIVGHDRRTFELSNAPLHMKQDTNSLEIQKIREYRDTAFTLGSKSFKLRITCNNIVHKYWEEPALQVGQNNVGEDHVVPLLLEPPACTQIDMFVCLKEGILVYW